MTHNTAELYTTILSIFHCHFIYSRQKRPVVHAIHRRNSKLQNIHHIDEDVFYSLTVQRKSNLNSPSLTEITFLFFTKLKTKIIFAEPVAQCSYINITVILFSLCSCICLLCYPMLTFLGSFTNMKSVSYLI